MHHDNPTRAELTEGAEPDKTSPPNKQEKKKPFVPPTISEPVNVLQATTFFQGDSLGGPGEV